MRRERQPNKYTDFRALLQTRDAPS